MGQLQLRLMLPQHQAVRVNAVAAGRLQIQRASDKSWTSSSQAHRQQLSASRSNSCSNKPGMPWLLLLQRQLQLLSAAVLVTGTSRLIETATAAGVLIVGAQTRAHTGPAAAAGSAVGAVAAVTRAGAAAAGIGEDAAAAGTRASAAAAAAGTKAGAAAAGTEAGAAEAAAGAAGAEAETGGDAATGTGLSTASRTEAGKSKVLSTPRSGHSSRSSKSWCSRLLLQIQLLPSAPAKQPSLPMQAQQQLMARGLLLQLQQQVAARRTCWVAAKPMGLVAATMMARLHQ